MSIDNQPNESCDCVFPHFLWWHTPGTLHKEVRPVTL